MMIARQIPIQQPRPEPDHTPPAADTARREAAPAGDTGNSDATGPVREQATCSRSSFLALFEAINRLAADSAHR